VLFLIIIFQDAIKLLHQVGELFWVIFLNDGLSEVLPCFPGVTNHRGGFFQVFERVTFLHRPDLPYPHD